MAESIGQFKGVDINPGTQEDINAQVAAINKGSTSNFKAGDDTPTISADELDVTAVDTATKTQPQGVDDLITSATDILGTPTTATDQEEKKLRAVEDERIRLMKELGGEQAFTLQQEEALGVNKFENELNDIYADILNKSASLRQGLVNQEGRPVAMEFITGRQAQMKRLAAAELEGLKAVYDATNARLLTAESRVQKAVDLKYEPIRNALEISKELITINKDRMTRSEKKRAEKKEAQLAALELQINRASEQETEVKSFLLTALQNGASPTQVSSAMTRASKGEMGINDAIAEFGYFSIDPAVRAQRDAIVKQQQDVEKGILTEKQADVADSLRKEYNGLAEVKDSKDLEANTTALLLALEEETGVGDISAINTFQRLVVDPGVAVREGDVSLLQSAQSFTDKATLKAKGLMVGDKLTEEARQQMRDLALGVYDARVAIVESQTSPIRTRAEESGIDFGKYIGTSLPSAEQIEIKVSPEAILDSYDEQVQQSGTDQEVANDAINSIEI